MIVFNALYSDQKLFKTAANGRLGLVCNQLDMFDGVTQKECVILANALIGANAINYDHNNSKCSIQNCSERRNFPVRAVVQSNMSIMLEVAIYPKSKYHLL